MSAAAESSSSTAQSAAALVTSVPDELKRLVRIIMRTFYGFDLFLCMDTLLTYPCIKEEDLAELLRLEAKQVHQNLVNLKKEKFVNERPIMETSGDGKQKIYSYFYINYKMMVNVIKYKLDKIRIQIETEEKQSTTRAIFKCTQCKKSFSDLETKDIFITMMCDHCGGDVDEDASSLPSRSSRNLLAKLNTQLEIVFVLLQKLEHLRLADDILRPEPMDMSHILEKISTSSGSSSNGNGGASAADKAASSANGRSGKNEQGLNGIKWSDRTSKQDLFSQTRIMVNFDTDDANGSKSSGSRPLKELPSIILANQTTDESINNLDNTGANGGTLNRDSLLLNNIKKAANDTLHNSNGMYANGGAAKGGLKPNAAQAVNDSVNSSASKAGGSKGASTSMPAPTGTNLETIILQKLLIHEKKASGGESSLNGNGNGNHGNGSGGGSTAEPLNRTTSFISINKKRDFEATITPNRSENGLASRLAGNGDELRDPMALKRRRLNNGDIVSDDLARSHHLNPPHSNGNYHHYGNQKSYSDGSDREMDEDMAAAGSTGDYDDDQASSSVASSVNCAESSSATLESSNGGSNGVDFMPLVTVQSKQVRLDRVTPKLINMMSEPEKDYYINVCRQLYTELYEI